MEIAATQETTQETIRGKILALIRSQPAITQKQLAEKTGLSHDGVKYHLNKLKTAGIVRRIGSTKSGSWQVME